MSAGSCACVRRGTHTTPLDAAGFAIGACADTRVSGYDDRFPVHQRIQQALLFARFSQHDNLYAHPMVRRVVISIVMFRGTNDLLDNAAIRTSYPWSTR